MRCGIGDGTTDPQAEIGEAAWPDGAVPHDQDGPILPAADRQRVARDQAVLAPRRLAAAQVLLDQWLVAQAPGEALHVGAELRI